MKTGITLGIVVLILLAGCKRATPAPTAAPVESQTTASALPGEEATPAAVIATATLPPPAVETPIQATAEPILQTPLPSLAGIHVHTLTSEGQLSLAAQPGMRWTRYDEFHWDRIQPEAGAPATYHWEAVNDAALEAVSRAGLNVTAMVLYTPGWAQKYSGSACGPVVEEALDDFAAFLGALAARYSQPPFNVHTWEIGNEPDVDHTLVSGHTGFGCWGEMDDPYYGGGYYARMLKQAYPAIKAADPQATVLVGGLLLACDPIYPPETSPGSGQLADCKSSKFLEGILREGGGDYFDGVSFHAYDYYMGNGRYENGGWRSASDSGGPALIPKARYLRGLLAAYGITDKILLNTEVAILCGRDGTEAACREDDFLFTKANYAAAANAAARALGLHANIWYSLTGWRASGLADGQLNTQPAYQAFKFSASQLAGTIYVGDIRQFEGVQGYEFTRNGVKLWVLWSSDGEADTISTSPQPTSVYDVMGNPLPTGKTLQIPAAPVYIEWQP